MESNFFNKEEKGREMEYRKDIIVKHIELNKFDKALIVEKDTIQMNQL